jgi:WD40 repeat protein/tRNA A-37 threonylcarbamoyl transferase component Bud32
MVISQAKEGKETFLMQGADCMITSSSLFCPQCGANIPAQARFCVSCGTPTYSTGIHEAIPQSLAPDHLLIQRYRIVKHIGSGGYGEVYKAADTQFADRSVAIKEMSQSGLTPQEVIQATEDFKREALMLAQLTHPNLPGIYDYFTDNGRWYLVMSFIEGETLEDYLEKAPGGKLPVDKALQIGIQLCSVLSYLHNRQPPIIFRDLKPSNVMRTPEGHLYLIDFGIARIFKQGQTKDTTALGSPGYAAPEQYGRKQTTPRADIYSLGATLHHMISGTDPSQIPFTFAPLQIPAYPGLNELILSMLAHDINQRPMTMNEVKQELQRIASGRPGLPPLAYPASPTPPSRPLSVPGHQEARFHRPISMPQPPNRYERDNIGPFPEWQRGGQQQMYSPPQSQRPNLSRRRFLLIGGVTAGAGLTAYLFGSFFSRGQSSPTSPEPRVSLAPAAAVPPLPGGGQFAVSWSPDGKFIATGNMMGQVEIQDAVKRTVISSHSRHTAPVAAIAWSPDSRRFASGSYDGTVIVWDIVNNQLIRNYTQNNGPVLSVAWSPDGTRVVSSDQGGTALIWEASTGKTLKRYNGHRDQVTSVSWSPDGRLIASASADRSVHLWNASTNLSESVSDQAILIYRGHGGTVQSVAWSPDGKQIVSGGDDATAQVWDARTGQQTLTYNHHKGSILHAVWSPDGQHIASASLDGSVHVWRANDGKMVAIHSGGHTPILSLSWSPDGGSIVFVDTNGEVYLREATLP